MQEQGLTKSLDALQEETGVTTRTVDDIDGFMRSVLEGHWDKVLQSISAIQLEPKHLIGLYEQIFWELAEAGETDAARMILRESEPMGLLRKEDESKYVKLENGLSTAVLSKTAGAKVDLMHRKEAKRAKLAQDLARHVTAAPKGRLMTLLGEALCFEELQQHRGSQGQDALYYDIFRGIVPETISTTDSIASTCYRSVTMPHGQHVECAAFSPDGAFFVVGLADGFIECWSPTTGQIRTDLVYQTHKSDYMVMETSILTMACSSDSRLLAVGTLNGDVAVWKVHTGVCIKRIPKAHTGGVSSIQFSPDSSALLTSGYDSSVRIFNIRSGALAREFVGHQAFVNQARFSLDTSRVLSASSDGTVRIWNSKSGECLDCIRPGEHQQLAQTNVKSLCPIPQHPDAFIVCAQDCPPMAYGANGSAGKRFNTKGTTQYSSVCCSSTGKFIYILGDDKKVHCFEYASGVLARSFEGSSADEWIGAAHHPQLNLFVTFDTLNTVKFWKSS